MLLLPLRRNHLRYPANKVISYSHRDKRLLTVTLNLGLGGMKTKTPYHLSPGELLDFTLVLGDASIGLKGRTVYSHALPNKQKISGIEFIDLSEQDWRMLRDYLIALERWPKKRGMGYAAKRRATREKKRSTVGSRR
jgi:hypothetical protein